MTDPTSQKQAKPKPGRPTVSAMLDDGTIVELVHDRGQRRTAFAIWSGGAWRIERSATGNRGQLLVPYSASNNLIQNDVVLLPSEPEEYGSDAQLVEELQAYVHRYVQVSPRFERVASHYVLLSWIHDGFNELPYLRLRGDFGSGKTRFLLTVGALCYKPIFASGASTISPIFHTLDAFRGTLVLDEGDFRFSDMQADIVKILNNGNVRGLPVLRTEVTPQKEFNPRAFHVFGPKVIATRGNYDDRALESRFITAEMVSSNLRDDIPISLKSSYHDEALRLRNKLLLYRFRTLGKRSTDAVLDDPTLEPRYRQIFAPLVAVAPDPAVRDDLHWLALEYSGELAAERSTDLEARVLQVLHELFTEDEGPNVPLKRVTAVLLERFGDEYDGLVTAKSIGALVRRRFGLKPYKSHGNFVIPRTEQGKLYALYARYGIDTGDEGGPPILGDVGDIGDVAGKADVSDDSA
jgi:hypothetical protein